MERVCAAWRLALWRMNTGSMLKIDSSNFSVVTYSTTSLTEWRHVSTCVRQSNMMNIGFIIWGCISPIWVAPGEVCF
jgi:hypothetical protein